MTQTLADTKPDVDLTNGNFYSDRGAHEVYRWMRANEPVFRDRTDWPPPQRIRRSSRPSAIRRRSPTPAGSDPTSPACRT